MPNTRTLLNHLTLHDWLNSRFGYKTTRDLLNDTKRFDEDGHTEICQFLSALPNLNRNTKTALPTYDANIKRHLAKINNTRTKPINLRYFQYLALLYTEIFLDWKFNRPSELLHQLNTFVKKRNDARAPGIQDMDTLFTENDLQKLAFYMATGAGKTIIMHINYHQFLHYHKEKIDHILLITPNQGLTEQHLRELLNADIPAQRFNLQGNTSANHLNTIQLTEITKLVEEKTGEGESVPVEAFEGNNLIFVDEGHKGSGGDVWRKIRDQLAETGFTFEYSATFGQALAAAKNADLVEEYGKAIAFDYSYRYFYEDGYGKDFRILNVRHDEEHQTQTLLLANLLTFYEQRRYFKENTEDVRTYGLDSPLWAFIGSKVNAVYTENRKARSDILNVIRFLHKFLKNENNWVTTAIQDIVFNRNTGLVDPKGYDIFNNKLNYIRNANETPHHIYHDILNEVFHTNTSGALHLQHIKNAPGEIALKTTHSTQHFGLIYIGDTAKFKKLVENDDTDIITEPENTFTESLFNKINTPNSPINILIGAKKFIEGWDSWRVTAMGLLNIGKQEGSQIIQLFGRGVRLRGKDMSLKRSSALHGEHPPHIALLETLNIFAVRANFMAQFREYLTREGIHPDDPVQLTIQIKRNQDFLNKKLILPKATPYHEGAKGTCEPLKVLTGTIITHTTQRIDIAAGNAQRGIHTEDHAEAALEKHIPQESLQLVDWEKIQHQLLEYKHLKGYHNLTFNTDTLEEILNPDKPTYKLTVTHESEVAPTSQAELQRLEELVLTLLQKYIDKYYQLLKKNWNDKEIRLRQLGDDPDDEKNFPDWTVHVPRTEAKDVQQEIEHLIENQVIYGPKLTTLPNVYNERHLYQPLLTNEGDLLENMSIAHNLSRTTPPALIKSEKSFLEDLNKYYRKQHPEKEIYILRNQSRGKGIGFYENEGFYPDFILWILDSVKQRIVFIEPHGMIHEDIYDETNPKFIFFKRLQELSHQHFRFLHIEMDAFIISATGLSPLIDRYPNENRDSFKKKWQILFSDHPNYLDPIFSLQT